MFGLTGIKKELFPYCYYGDVLTENTVGTISGCGDIESKKWDEKDYKQFNINIDGIAGCRIDDNHFNMYLYAKFYFLQDVNILRQGFMKFREGFQNDFNLDVVDFISISSIAYELLNQKVFYTNGNLFQLGGVVQRFCQQSIRGGRCMCADNKKHHVVSPQNVIQDFDAVSLYPSAMMRLYSVEGVPILMPEGMTYEELKTKTAFIVEIQITSIKKHYHFPLIADYFKGEDNQKVLNWNDTSMIGHRIVVNDIVLDDLIKFQEVEFKIIRGYYWTGKKD
jgi:hypothetical protein